MHHLLPLLPLLSAAAAIPFTILAGGPPIKPIPSDCKLEHIHHHQHHHNSDTKAFTVSDAFSSAHAVFTEYLPTYYNNTYSRQVCLEQCYGYGNPGDCVSALWASNVTYTAYGVQNVGVVCDMFSQKIAAQDLVPVTNGEYLDARATDINCPTTTATTTTSKGE